MPAFLRNIIGVIVLFSFSQSRAQVKFSASVSPREIGKEDYAELKLMVENAREVTEINPPHLADFVILSGPSRESGMSSINGNVTRYTGLSYVIRPRRTGTLKIPAAIAIADGKKMTSQPLTLKVVPGSTIGNNVPGGGLFGAGDPFAEPEKPLTNEDIILKDGENPAEKIARNMIVKLETDKKTCYVGEPVVATYKLYTRLPSESNMTKNPSFNGFSVIDLQQMGNNDYQREKLNGREYNVFTLRKSQLYPLQSGNLELEIAEIENNIHFVKQAYANRQSTTFGSAGLPPEALNDQRATLQSKPMTILVKPLPDAGKPADFKGAVGNFSVSAMLLKDNFSTDDAGQLRVVVSGEGNLQLVTAPAVAWPAGIEGFDAKTTDDLYKGTVPVSGRKIADYQFTVAKAGNYVLPPVSFSFFDPHTATYKTVTTKPISFSVSQGTGRTTYNPGKAGSAPNMLVRFFSNRLRVVSMVAVLIIIGLILWLKRDKQKEQKVKNEIAAAEEKAAAERLAVQELIEQQKNPLEGAEQALQAGDTAIFYKKLDEELKHYLSNKLKIQPQDINKKSIAEELDKNGISNETCLLLQHLLDEIAWERYTPFASNEKMQDMYGRANDMVQLLNTYKI